MSEVLRCFTFALVGALGRILLWRLGQKAQWLKQPGFTKRRAFEGWERQKCNIIRIPNSTLLDLLASELYYIDRLRRI
jgi:hypothetical protein